MKHVQPPLGASVNKPWDKPRLTILTASASDARNANVWGVEEGNRHVTKTVQTSKTGGGMTNLAISYTIITAFMWYGAGPPPS